jgi:hypothetical protein
LILLFHRIQLRKRIRRLLAHLWFEARNRDHSLVSADRVRDVLHVVVNEADVVQDVRLLVLGELVRVVQIVKCTQRALVILGVDLFLCLRNLVVDFLAGSKYRPDEYDAEIEGDSAQFVHSEFIPIDRLIPPGRWLR